MGTKNRPDVYSYAGLWEKAERAGLTRRKFLGLLAAGGATAVLAACSKPGLLSTTSSITTTTTPETNRTTKPPAATTVSPPSPTGGVAAIRAPQPPGGVPTNQTVGLLYKENRAFNGYTLFAPNFAKTTYLIDIDGKLIHKWESAYLPGKSVYLLEKGILLRSTHLSEAQGSAGGGMQKIAWDGSVLWDYKYLGNTYIPHHDIKPLPNGNILMIVWDIRTKEEAIAAGRKPTLLDEQQGQLWAEKLVEVKPGGTSDGTIVWEWRLWDHLVQDFDPTKSNHGVVADHPELMDINFGGGGSDWIHANAVDYNPKLDQIVICAHNQGEIWIIDHSTTTAQAASHSSGKSGKGGDILYRWGNPQSYRAGTVQDHKLSTPHSVHWIRPGLQGENNLLIFNNGNNRPDGSYSSVDEIKTPVDGQGRYAFSRGPTYGPGELHWSYKAPNKADFFADTISGAERQPNGNTLICHGPLGTFFEITRAGDIVWQYVNPVTDVGPLAQGATVPTDHEGGTRNAVFRANRYAPDFPGLTGKDLTPGQPIEQTS